MFAVCSFRKGGPDLFELSGLNLREIDVILSCLFIFTCTTCFLCAYYKYLFVFSINNPEVSSFVKFNTIFVAHILMMDVGQLYVEFYRKCN